MTTQQLADQHNVDYRSLEDFCIGSVAFTAENALRMVELLREEVTPILGVDTYKLMADGYLDVVYDFCFCERKDHELIFEYTQRSCDMSANHIRRVAKAMEEECKKEHSELLFDITNLDLEWKPDAERMW